MTFKQIYALYDTQTMRFAPPFIAENGPSAFKMLENFMLKENFPLDYELWNIGTFRDGWNKDDKPNNNKSVIKETQTPINLTFHLREFIMSRNADFKDKLHFQWNQQKEYETEEWIKNHDPKRLEHLQNVGMAPKEEIAA